MLEGVLPPSIVANHGQPDAGLTMPPLDRPCCVRCGTGSQPLSELQTGRQGSWPRVQAERPMMPHQRDGTDLSVANRRHIHGRVGCSDRTKRTGPTDVTTRTDTAELAQSVAAWSIGSQRRTRHDCRAEVTH